MPTNPVPLDGLPTAEALTARVRATLPSLPPASARVAQFVLDAPDTVMRSTIRDLVDIVGASEATIVRAARALGFRGYPDLRFALATAAGQRRPERRVTGDITETTPLPEVIDKISLAEEQALRETAAHLDADALDAVAVQVVGARKVTIYGAGASWLVAADLQQKLQRIGIISHTPMDNHLAITDAVLLTPADVAIAVSHSGETAETVSFLQHAATTGARTVALTSGESSTLSKTAGRVLFAAGRDSVFRPAALSSRISQLMVVDCLFVAVAQRTYERTTKAIATTHEALSPSRLGRKPGRA